MGTADVGTGSRIKFGTSAFVGNLMNIAHSGISRPDIKTSHLQTTGGDTFIPGDLYNPGEVKVEWEVSATTVTLGAQFPNYAAVAETFTIYLTATTAGKPTVAGSGFVKDLEYSLPHEEMMTGSCTIKLSGNLTHGTA